MVRVNGTQTPNTAPTAAHNTVTMAEDGRYEFSATDFGFHDTNPADALVSVRIVTAPALGALALDGTAVTAGDVVARADIDDRKLIFTPVTGGSGNNYARFTFKVNDGTVFSASAYTMRIDVTPTPPLTGQIFVDNTAETDYGVAVAGNLHSQSFTTGPNTGGYILSSIGVVAEIVGENGGDDFSVAVFNADTSGAPVALHTSLIPPGNFPQGVSTIHFHAPPNTRLRPDTTYSIVLGSGRTPSRFRQISATQSNADNASGSGWSIGDALHLRRSAASPWSSPADDRSVKIVIRGNTASGIANNAPVFSPATVDRSIAENTAAGRNVGAVVTATDADNDPLTYTLGGADMASFDIDEASGQIRTKAGVSYDHEAKPSYTVTVTASDGAAGADADVTISVTDVAEPPRAPATPVVSAVAQSAISLSVTWAAPANAGRPAIDSYDMQYRASGATDWIDGPDHSTTTTVTGPVAYTLHEARVTGLTADTEYEARVRAANAEGNSGWSTPPGAGRTNTLTNNAPVFSPAIVDRSIVENIAAGEAIGAPVTATDADNETLAYTLGGADEASFDIDGTTGQISTKADVSYNFEAKRSYTVTVTASDGAATAAAIVTISVIDVAEPPDAPSTISVTAVTGSTTSLSVSWVAPANDGRPAIDSYDVQYRVGSSGPWTDVPQDVTGTTTTITITSLAADTSYEVRVRAANAEGDSGWSDPPGAGRTHPLTHIAPMFSSLSQTREIAENTAAGVNVGAAVTATDVNNDTLSYTLGGADAASFDFDGTTGQISTKSGVSYDFETKDSYAVTVTASDGAASAVADVAISVTDVPELPDTPATPTVSAVSGSTPSLSVSWIAPPNEGRPPIDHYHVQWHVSGATDWNGRDVDAPATTTIISDLTADTEYEVRVRADNAERDSGFSDPPWVGRTNTLTNNAPVFSSSNVALSIAENTAAGVDIGAAVTATDADAGDTLIYTLRGADADFFDIVETTGQIRTKDNVSYDFEARPSYTVTVRVSDGDATAEAGVTISITDVAEPPATPATPTVSAVADSNTRLTVSWDAPANAGKPDIDSYDVQYRLSGATAWTDGPQNVTTTTTTTTVTGLTANTLYEVQVRATNDEGDSDWSNPPGEGRTNTATTNNAAEGAPTITGTAQVGETLTAATTGITDADGLTSPTYTYQWIRANGSEVDIAGANSSTYTLDAADLGKTIKVKVSFTDDGGTPETLTSAATATVTAAIITPGSAGLVSNLNQLATDNKLYFGSGSTKYSFAQGFTTGANPGGYTLTLIDVAFSAGVSAAAIGAVTASVWTADSSGNPDAEMYTLNKPASFDRPTTTTSGGNNEFHTLSGNYSVFTAPANTTLNASTQYLVVVSGGPDYLYSTASDAETGAAGWLIANAARRKQTTAGSWAAQSDGHAMSIRVNGTTGGGTPTNTAPTVANAIPNQTAMVGTALNYEFPTNTFADTDAGDTLTYTATQSDDSALPSWLSFAPETRTFSGTPQTADLGTVSVKVTASDGTESVSDIFDIVVSAGTTTATCTGMCLVSNLNQLATTSAVTFGSTVTRNLVAQGFMTGASTGGYTLTSIEVAFGSGQNATQLGNLTAGVWSDDGSGNPAAELFTLTKPASIVAATKSGGPITLSVTGNYTVFTAPANTTLDPSTSYHMVLEGGSSKLWSTAIDGETGATGWSIADVGHEKQTAPTPGNWAAARDDNAASNAMLIRVNGTTGGGTTNTAPTVANEILDQAATVGTALNYEFSANTFADTDAGDTLTYTATKPDDSALPSWLSFAAATRTFSGTPQAADLGTVSVKVTASDGSESVSDTFDIVVSAAPDDSERLLVSNFEQTVDGEAQIIPFRDIVGVFTTGARGAELHSIEFRLFSRLPDIAQLPSATLYRASVTDTRVATRGEPVAALTAAPGSPRPAAAAQTVEFNVPDDTPRPRLDADTTYLVVLEDTGYVSVESTTYPAEDADGAPGWAVDGIGTGNSSPWSYGTTASLLMRVNGTPAGETVATAPEAPASLDATEGDDKEVRLSWAKPESDGGAPISKYQYRYSAGPYSADPRVDPETAWTDVPDGSDTDTSLADERSVIVTDLDNGRQYAFEVRAVNSVRAGAAATATATPAAPSRRGFLVSNFGQPVDGAAQITRLRDIVGVFTTGALGATLDSIEFRLYSRTPDIAQRPSATLYRGSVTDTRATPGTRVATLTAAPGSPRPAATAQTVAFNAPDDTRLEANTTYLVVLSGSAYVRVESTNSSAEDAGGASDWTIDGVGAGNSSPWSYGTSDSLLMSVNSTTDSAARETASQQLEAPVAISVADASVTEGADAVLAFEVTLDRASSAPVTVDYATGEGEATPGDDYVETSGTLTFAPDETSKTVEVEVLEDSHDEGSETMRLTLANAAGARIADGTAIGTIENSDPMPKAWMVRFGRTVGSQVVDALGQRLAGGQASYVTVAGVPLTGSAAPLREDEADDAFGLPEWAKRARREQEARTITADDLRLRSAFHLSSGSGEPEGPAFTTWGRVSTGGFSAQADDVTTDGDVTTGLLGFDAEWDNLLAGVMLSQSTGEGAYRLDPGKGADGGTVESDLTGVYPYARIDLDARASAWALAGAGSGSLTLKRDGRDAMKTDLSMRMGALGVQGQVLDGTGPSGMRLNLKSDAMWVGTKSARSADMVGTDGDVMRLRLVAQGERDFVLAEQGTLTPSAELGLRHDGGDAETGVGVEFGAGLRYMVGSFTIEARARTLVAHQASGYEEWGASAAVRLAPSASGRGLSVSIAPTWGRTGSASEWLWSARDMGEFGGGGGFEADGRIEAQLGYGFALPHDRGLLTPYFALTLGSEGGRTMRGGARWLFDSDLAVTLDATRTESAGAEAGNDVRVQAALRF